MGDEHEGWDSTLFVDEVDEESMCGICSEVLMDAVETPCGHAYCYICLRDWMRKKPVCPMDQNEHSFEDCRPMVRDRRRILGMKVRCEFDCGEEMELGKYREHRQACASKPDDWEEPPVPVNEKTDPTYPGSQSAAISPVASPSVQRQQLDAPPNEEFEIVLDEGPEQHDGDDDAKFARQLQLEEAQAARQRQMSRIQQQPQMRMPGAELMLAPVMSPLELAPAEGVPYDDDPPPYYNRGGEGGRRQQGQQRPRGQSRRDQSGRVDRALSKSGRLREQELKRREKQTGCCGCNDKCWCCCCCIFWLIIAFLVVYVLMMCGGFQTFWGTTKNGQFCTQ